MWTLYIARFSKNKLYTGITVDINRRIKQHNNGIGAKSLKGKGPVELVYTEHYLTNNLAAKREREIKSWNREKKLNLITKG
jgi:predicted GIY-YIG superfamily endonuclease